MRRQLTPVAVRAAAAAMVRREANICENMGDPEGAARQRDLARAVSKMRITEDVKNGAPR